MVLYFIGIGLSDEKDITIRYAVLLSTAAAKRSYSGLEAVRRSDYIYLENYTSILTCPIQQLEALYERSIILADREMVETVPSLNPRSIPGAILPVVQEADTILKRAVDGTVSFLVVGDSFGATTHGDLQLRAHELGIAVHVIHNASIMNAIGITGLQLYRFGETVSIVLFTPTWRPDSFYDKIAANSARGLHTLCLLDIKVKELSEEALCRGKKVYDPPRYMTIPTAIEQLLEVVENQEERVYDGDSLCVGCARLGAEDQVIRAGSMNALKDVDFGPPLHSLIIVGDLHPIEEELLKLHRF